MKKIMISAVATLCVASVALAQTRPVYVHMKSGEVKEYDYDEVDYISFGDEITYDLEVEATYQSCIYYGGTSYIIQVSDAPISASGLPTQAGQNLLRLYVFADKSEDSNDAKVAAGRYGLTGEIAVGNLYNSSPGYTCLLMCTGMDGDTPLGSMLEFESGAVTIEYAADGTASLVFRGKLVDTGAEGQPIGVKVTYKGKLEYDNQDPASYKKLTEDVEMVPTGLSGGYSNVDGMYGSYTLTYYNLELDESGFIVGPGELMNFELLTAEGNPMDVAAQLPGDYTITSASVGPWAPGNYLGGEMYDWYGFSMPLGTYYTVYGEGGAETRLKAFVTGGTVHVDVEGDNVTMIADVEVEGGHKITMNYTAPASSIIDRANMAPAQPKAGVLTPFKLTNIKQNNVLRLIKK